MPLADETSIPIPGGLHVVIWLEFILFVPSSLSHYMGGYKPMWSSYSANPVGRTALWSGEMLNGVGAWVLMYMLGCALWSGSITLVEIEVLFLSHALWYGVIFSVTPPGPAFWLVALFNPHTYMYIGVVATAYDLPRPICYAASAIVLLFGLYRRWRQVPLHCFDKDRTLVLDDYLDALKALDGEDPAKQVAQIEGIRKSALACLGQCNGEPSNLPPDRTTISHTTLGHPNLTGAPTTSSPKDLV